MIDNIWQQLFQTWPAGIARRGMITTTQAEAIPFKGFMIKGETLLLERTNPDPQGTRYIVLAFDSIAAVKFVDPIKAEIFRRAGYEGQFSAV